MTAGAATAMHCPLCAGHHEIETCNVPIRWNRLDREDTDRVFQGDKQRKDLNKLIRSATARCFQQPAKTLEMIHPLRSTTGGSDKKEHDFRHLGMSVKYKDNNGLDETVHV
ncbi:hypothetical protein FN846DRAFT_910132 [Sphaerosporella brunnea]|uniref:Uncharacterized protein n=1 Tax=Sphaerosporella brunnea TaxID=1250544 RepID=A0A5J5ENW8_9PEZI|nr:hypothetical protein FN846DRAFT_910132 [Sphaerosporella brunnea]